MLRARSLLVACLLLPGGIACGADGVVVDPSGRPIPNARVECGGDLTVTARDGRFSLPAARCRAAVSAPGFETVHVELVSNNARIELPIAALSQRIVVSATRRETPAEQAGVAASLVSRAEIERQQFPMLGDMLRGVPGLQVARSGRHGSLTQVFARGGQRTATLVMVDGIAMNDPGGEINLAGFTTGALDRIEVVLGPQSALFGAEASSAVVQLFTRRGDPERRLPRGSVSYERGSFQTDRWMANLAGGSGARLDYALGVEQLHTVGEYPNDYFRNTSGTANAGFQISPNTRLRGVFRSYDSMLGVPNQVGYGIYDFDANEATRDTAAGIRLEDMRGSNFVQHVAFSYHHLRDLFVDSVMDGPYEIAALVRDTTHPVPRTHLVRLVDPNTTPPPGMRLVTQSVTLFPFDPFLNVTSRKAVEYQGTLAHSTGATVFGYAFERQGGEVTGRDVTRDNHGLFVHEQAVVAGRLFLSGGLRLERNSAFGTKLTPRGAASYRLTPSTHLRASAGVGITEPSLLQNFARDPWYVGNPDLRPEKTTSFEAGVVQEFFGRRVRAEVSAFANSYRDLITFAFTEIPSTWQNIEASRARGLEFAAQAKPAPWILLSGNYTRMWTRITQSSSPNALFNGTGQELPRRPGNSGAASITLTPRRWMLHAGALLVGERQDTDLFGVTRNPGYQAVYAAGSLRLHPHVTPFLRLDNLLNQRYSEILGYPAPSRSVHGGLRLEW
ncbi:MAG TPA: TonB-dependent receptor [Bryobacteraceae bacterium]|mgnify:CR=1 FL=1|nr:TonB-dependent receptor [Bryobacteraceae bacterium]HOQ44934.1 TonB-dependent receptor [Bryobacteraceae bacterium]HPQ13992.1 TonB-dependent receptor [Bryobacteraceae bacterium]HPU72056.1 TonB-dependent receptor [Bryobacteraceae bacterium]